MFARWFEVIGVGGDDRDGDEGKPFKGVEKSGTPCDMLNGHSTFHGGQTRPSLMCVRKTWFGIEVTTRLAKRGHGGRSTDGLSLCDQALSMEHQRAETDSTVVLLCSWTVEHAVSVPLRRSAMRPARLWSQWSLKFEYEAATVLL